MILLFVPVVAGSALAISIGISSAVFVLAGVYFGAVLREIGQQRMFLQWWPLTREITDWDKVEHALKEGEMPASGADVASLAPAKPRTRWAPAVAIGVALFVLLFGGMIGTQRAMAYAHDPRRNNPPDNVIILTTSWCPYCMSLRAHLAEKGVHYTELDIEQTTEGRWAHRAVNGRGIPIIIIGDKVLRGVGDHFEKIDAALARADVPMTPAYRPSLDAGESKLSEVRDLR
jgi:glutaredoxin